MHTPEQVGALEIRGLAIGGNVTLSRDDAPAYTTGCKAIQLDEGPARPRPTRREAGSVMLYAPGMPFAPDDLDLLVRTQEVRIETRRRDGTTTKTIIWIMTDGEDVFVRSVQGDRGWWYRRALADPSVTIHAGGLAIEAHAVPADDDDSIARCSAAIVRKYAGRPGEKSMLKPRALPTTLRLEPA